jgi:hypothetical protein
MVEPNLRQPQPSLHPRSRPLSGPAPRPLAWASFEERLRDDPDKRRRFRQGDHITLIGPTESGKTHMAIRLAEMRQYSLFLATKKRDPLVAQLQSRGWHISHDLELLYVDDEPVNPRIVYWPPRNEKLSLEGQQRLQARQLRAAFHRIDRDGGWAVVVDEAIWVSQNLGLTKELNHQWFGGRTNHVSMIACAQRPTHVPLYAFSQASHVFLFSINDQRDVIRFREIGGNTEAIVTAVQRLDNNKHEALYINTRTREFYIVVAPAN